MNILIFATLIYIAIILTKIYVLLDFDDNDDDDGEVT